MVSMAADRTETIAANFNAIRISIASPDQIKSWSHGEVTKPETINYRTLRPEKDGLFCERLFGPTKDWECFCGKYKRIRYRGVVCDRCGVEVTRAKVRRERMGHITLAAPVAHIWFSKTNPSRLGVLLDLSPRNLERVLYFAQHIIIDVDETARQEAIDAVQSNYDLDVEKLRETAADTMEALNRELSNLDRISADAESREETRSRIKEEITELRQRRAQEIEQIRQDAALRINTIHFKQSDISSAVRLDELPSHLTGHYIKLELSSRDVDSRAIQQAYRQAMLKYHPDRNPDSDTTKEAQEINLANEILSDPEKRKEYDAKIINAENGLRSSRQVSPKEIDKINKQLTKDIEKINKKTEAEIEKLESQLPSKVPDYRTEEEIQQEIDAVNKELTDTEKELETQLKAALDDLNDIQKMKLLAESRYRDLNDRYPYVFKAGMGAEAILEILRQIDLEAMRDQLINDMHSTAGQRRQKAIKRLRVVESFRQSGGARNESPAEGSRVENMILTVMPVLPPELRPMVQLDGGRFATSDLNDLYRRVINRNNRLKRLMGLGAPEIIIRNEKRMLQEAVDALIDNGRRGRPIQGSHNHKLKSLSDLLRGKQGRFRQNLLGKRVDYSGRSVIVVGPELKMDECGLPRRMALELFKPFVMHRLVGLGIAPNIKNAKRMVERARGEVWDILEEVIKNRPVLLNRAPTLHRLGIQAFKPKLIDGNAIQIHPLVCSAFNADFDGDQMAVHVPLSSMAVLEANETMLSTHNMLSPASGDPLVAPTLDMVMGCYYLTEVDERSDIKGIGRKFYDINDAREAYAAGDLDLRAPIRVRRIRGAADRGSYYDTTLGRLLFNEILPDKFVKNETLDGATRVQNKHIDRKALNELTAHLYRVLSNDETAEVLDAIKNLGFEYATSSGITIAINDIQVSPEKATVLAEAESLVDQYSSEYQMGLISEEERYGKTIDVWAQASFKTAALVDEDITNYGGVGVMALSGTKGNTSQINQMAGMRGLMNRPRSGVIEMPVKSSFREGLSALEYFISTHGARKGLTDTALNTASSGYLTRRLVDIAQEVIVQGEDCGTFLRWVPRLPAAHTNMELQERISGRRAASVIADPDTGEILVERNEAITKEKADELVIKLGITEIPVRSPLTCASMRGVCRMCYGDLAATGQLVQEGQAVGIIAAQSIGEPGTQLTMRTFHTGGVFGVRDERAIRRANVIQNIANRISADDKSVSNELAQAIAERVGFPTLIITADSSDSDVFAEYFMHYDEDDHNRALRRLFTEVHEGLSKILYPREGNPQEVTRSEGNQDLAGMISSWVEQSINLRSGIGDRLIYIATGVRREVESLNLDITGGLPRVEEIFEARIPKTTAVLADIDGIAEVESNEESHILRITYSEDIREEYALPEESVILVHEGDFVSSGMVLAAVPQRDQYTLPDGAEIRVDDGEEVQAGMTLAVVPQRERYALPDGAEALVDDGEEVQEGMTLASVPNRDSDSGTVALLVAAAKSGRVEVSEDSITIVSAGEEIIVAKSGRVEVSKDAITVVSTGEEIIATESGRVEITPGCVWLVWEDTEVREHVFPTSTYLNVQDGETVNAGDALTGGPLNPHDILRIRGREELQSHVIDQVQAVYRSQGVHIHDKHIEIILRQMLRRVQVQEPGDTEFIPGEVVDKFAFQEQVERVLAEGGEPATAEQVLLGVTRASLRTDSFLSAASFQETTRVLTEAAVRGQQDYLLGLKENVIIGRLIPAQVEIPGMADLLKPPPAPDLSAISPGGWLSRPAAGENDSDAAGLNLFAPETDDDGFERMVQAVTRTYAREDADDDEDEEDDDLFDDDEDEEDEGEGEGEEEQATPVIEPAAE